MTVYEGTPGLFCVSFDSQDEELNWRGMLDFAATLIKTHLSEDHKKHLNAPKKYIEEVRQIVRSVEEGTFMVTKFSTVQCMDRDRLLLLMDNTHFMLSSKENLSYQEAALKDYVKELLDTFLKKKSET